MQSEEIKAYTAVMEEVKRRTDVVWGLVNQRIKVMYLATHVETAMLQLRMILELVALASLSANKKVFEGNRKNLKKYWNLKKIINDLRKLNSNFYPVPIIEVPSKDIRVKNNLVEMKAGFMTCDDLIKLHGKCSNLLHAQNPFKKNADYKHYEKEIPNWMNQIMKLLNCHQIRLLDSDSFYLVHMKEERDDQVHLYEFVPTELPPT